MLLCADTLFSLGCGRLLEGTAADMFASLRKLAALPGDTLVCCGHEYTQSNARFARDASIPATRRCARWAERGRPAARRRASRPCPAALADELAENPFLRAPDAATFADLRARKDKF